MQLRLKKMKEGWKCKAGKVIRTNDACYFHKINEMDGEFIYDWSPANKYQTEYRKMRAALLKYLEPKEEKPYYENGIPEPEKVLMEVIVSLGEKVEGLNEKVTKLDKMNYDLRTERRQAEERYKEVKRDLEAANQRINMLVVQIAKMEALKPQSFIPNEYDPNLVVNTIEFSQTKPNTNLPRTVTHK